mgnify:CR=1 FL=1
MATEATKMPASRNMYDGFMGTSETSQRQIQQTTTAIVAQEIEIIRSLVEVHSFIHRPEFAYLLPTLLPKLEGLSTDITRAAISFR